METVQQKQAVRISYEFLEFLRMSCDSQSVFLLLLLLIFRMPLSNIQCIKCIQSLHTYSNCAGNKKTGDLFESVVDKYGYGYMIWHKITTNIYV